MKTLFNDLLKHSHRFQALYHHASPECLVCLLSICVKWDESIFKLWKVLIDAQELLELVALLNYRYEGQLLEVRLQGFASVFYQG